MPNKMFLETYPLYRKMAIDKFPETLDKIPKVNINMSCQKCRSNQTFVMKNEYWENYQYMNVTIDEQIIRLQYKCSHCSVFERAFYVKLSKENDKKYLLKVGQFPAWEIHSEPNIEKLLGHYSSYYKKALICESQGYGIGAFSYYRRIVEEIIDGLLEEISDLLIGTELNIYQKALEETKKTIVTSEKIDLVKDLLPPILRPDGLNPLAALHSALSEGLHAESDEECLEIAEHCRETILFLVNQVSASKQTAKSFTNSMKKLLDKRAEKRS